MRFLCVLLLGTSVARAELLCPGTEITVSGADPATEARVCAIVEDAAPGLAACGLPLETPLSLTLVDDLPQGCLGLYHCGEGRIEILSPDLLTQRRLPGSLFAAVPGAPYFDSIVVHELAHAAHDALPCPSGVCLATSEYLAYNMQIMSLAPEDRAHVEAVIDMGERVSHDEISAMVLFFSPDTFASRAWAHLNQRDDPCAYLRHVAKGDFTFDRAGP
ncbi:MAG: hypothetical protein CML50_15900 [Rhodobacteraceae bacterium]|jgi:hypothetical protein|uniref:Uncharacterized protein n=1 Tax=Salipiger profundus TaxID=1229727 RepID=A0A1U7D857_9RHOB|nr:MULTISPECIES: DUF6639 family protein [Salipiger]APX24298.1 hypothetical protein Ga0080559_TMP3502 [Salipiger profundus]MAB07484.1 hypothetical protein [Paracoccaceae bacterium]GFZ95841.1 hypothetical protein GCM10011326_03680 [Salipiger profundus]SFB84664.1 hypothetical protein SAMN05444415_101175 [Salipiger profundus]|tara:strand:+ start:193 stop:846 length:654 start_codon:yes stop_codon:yes gene_type:complete